MQAPVTLSRQQAASSGLQQGAGGRQAAPTIGSRSQLAGMGIPITGVMPALTSPR